MNLDSPGQQHLLCSRLGIDDKGKGIGRKRSAEYLLFKPIRSRSAFLSKGGAIFRLTFKFSGDYFQSPNGRAVHGQRLKRPEEMCRNSTFQSAAISFHLSAK